VSDDSQNVAMKKIIPFSAMTNEVKQTVLTFCMVVGDLHPGNVLVDPEQRKFILLDVGIVTEYTDEEHQLIVDLLTAFIRMDGRRAGRLAIDDSNRRLHGRESAKDEEAYIDKIEALTIKARGKDYFMEHLGTYITYICDAAAAHHVLMNEAFVSAMLAVKIQEGIALGKMVMDFSHRLCRFGTEVISHFELLAALDPSIEIWRVANPIILESEARRKLRDWRLKVAETIFGKDSPILRTVGLS
jgi:aarF domain-containing kinase